MNPNSVITEPKNIFSIIFKSFLIYLKNIIPLTRPMLFPVFGQVIGVILILGPTYFLTEYIQQNFSHPDIIKNAMFIMLGIIISVIPGFFIFIKAFWEFLVVTVSLNLMVLEVVKDGKLKDYSTYNNAVKLRTKDYIILLLFLTLIWLVLPIMPFMLAVLELSVGIDPIVVGFSLLILFSITFILLCVISVYLSLCYQVFAFESLSAIETLKKSCSIVNKNFFRTLILAIVLGIITGMILPMIIEEAVIKLNLLNWFVIPFKAFIEKLIRNPKQLSDFIFQTTNGVIKLKDTVDVTANMAFLSTLKMIITLLLLPLGSCVYSMLYFDILSRKHHYKKKF